MTTLTESGADRPPAALPPADPLRNPTSDYARWCWWLAAAAVPLTLPLLLLDTQIAWSVGGSVAAVLVLLAVGLTYMARQVDAHLAAFRRGEYLARWSYSPDDARGFADRVAGHAGRQLVWTPVGAGAGVFLLGGLAWLKGEWGDNGPSLVTVALIGVVVGGAVAGLRYALARRRSRRPAGRLGDAYVGGEAAYFDGQYLTWVFGGWLGKLITPKLVSATLDEGRPAVLELVTKTGNQFQTLRIPVPNGHEAEARELIGRLPAEGPLGQLKDLIDRSP